MPVPALRSIRQKFSVLIEKLEFRTLLSASSYDLGNLTGLDGLIINGVDNSDQPSYPGLARQSSI